MTRVFVGSAAVAAGSLTKYQLRAHCQRVLPDIYAPRDLSLTLRDRTEATWLWSRRQGVIQGPAAAALHGSKWVPDDAAIEVNWPGRTAPRGVITRRDTLLTGETTTRSGITVTSVERTAFDLARTDPVGLAVQKLDAFAAATGFQRDGVLALAARHPRVKGLRSVPTALELTDAGAQSPKETWLRLLLIDAGFPRPQTQIPVLRPDGHSRYYLDMGWPELLIAVEYDGEQHRLDREIYRDDLTRSDYVAAKGWWRIRVIAGDRRPTIVRRVRDAWDLRSH